MARSDVGDLCLPAIIKQRVEDPVFPPVAPPGYSYVYLFHGSTDLLKPGRANDVRRRLKQLNAGNGIELRLAGILAGPIPTPQAKALEDYIHDALKRLGSEIVAWAGDELHKCPPVVFIWVQNVFGIAWDITYRRQQDNKRKVMHRKKYVPHLLYGFAVHGVFEHRPTKHLEEIEHTAFRHAWEDGDVNPDDYIEIHNQNVFYNACDLAILEYMIPPGFVARIGAGETTKSFLTLIGQEEAVKRRVTTWEWIDSSKAIRKRTVRLESPRVSVVTGMSNEEYRETRKEHAKEQRRKTNAQRRMTQ